MKRIFAFTLGLLVSQCLTGCFSAAMRMNSGGAGTGGASGTQRVIAGALDAVTLPIQAPVLAVATATQANESATQAKRTAHLEEIRRDPEYLFAHRFSLSSETIRMALLDRKIPFTEDHLRRLGGKKAWTRPYVAANPRCPKDLLDEIWKGMAQLSGKDRSGAAYFLASNPTIPDAWLEEIAQRTDLYDRTSDYAKSLLDVRKGVIRTPGPRPLPPGAPPLNGR